MSGRYKKDNYYYYYYLSQIDNVKLHIRDAKVSYYKAALNNADTKATFQVLNSLTK